MLFLPTVAHYLFNGCFGNVLWEVPCFITCLAMESSRLGLPPILRLDCWGWGVDCTVVDILLESFRRASDDFWFLGEKISGWLPFRVEELPVAAYEENGLYPDTTATVESELLSVFTFYYCLKGWREFDGPLDWLLLSAMLVCLAVLMNLIGAATLSFLLAVLWLVNGSYFLTSEEELIEFLPALVADPTA